MGSSLLCYYAVLSKQMESAVASAMAGGLSYLFVALLSMRVNWIVRSFTIVVGPIIHGSG